MEKSMTLKDALISTYETLGTVCVPVSMQDAIEKINGARSNIKLCIDAIEESEKAEMEKREINQEEQQNADIDAE